MQSRHSGKEHVGGGSAVRRRSSGLDSAYLPELDLVGADARNDQVEPDVAPERPERGHEEDHYVAHLLGRVPCSHNMARNVLTHSPTTIGGPSEGGQGGPAPPCPRNRRARGGICWESKMHVKARRTDGHHAKRDGDEERVGGGADGGVRAQRAHGHLLREHFQQRDLHATVSSCTD